MSRAEGILGEASKKFDFRNDRDIKKVLAELDKAMDAVEDAVEKKDAQLTSEFDANGRSKMYMELKDDMSRLEAKMGLLFQVTELI